MAKAAAPSYRAALRLTLAYAVFAALWITCSDLTIETLFPDPASLVRAGLIKGTLFVLLTSALLFFLARRWGDKLRTDIAQRDRMQSERQRALDLLESISESSDDAIFAKDLEGRYILFNRAAGEFVGKPPAAVIGHDDRALFPADQADLLIAADRDIVATNRTVCREEHITLPVGDRVFLATKGPLRDQAGRVTGTFGISRDITTRSAVAEALRDREEKLAAIVGYSPSALSLKTPDGRYAVANPNLQRIHGLSEAEIIGKTDFDLYPEAVARSFRVHDEEVLRTRQRLSVEEEVPADGAMRTYMSHMFPVLGENRQVRYICRISLDVTDRKRAEAEVRQLTEDLAATLHAIPDLLFELDENGRYIKVEATAEHLLTAPSHELVGHTVQEMLPPQAAAVVMAALAGAGEKGTDYGRTLTLPLAGRDHHFELSVARKTLPSGVAPHFIVLSRDITARQRNELELRQSNEELVRFNAASIGRELQMIALKRQINALSHELGRAPPFDLAFADGESDGPLP